MKEIYTPQEWYAFFGGSPTLVIADDGYIYDAKEYNNLMPRPCGYINLQEGEIYGRDYSSVSRRPIAYIREKNGIQEIYQKRPEASLGAVPFLYIVGDAIYSREEYYKILGGNPSAYVKSTEVKQTNNPERKVEGKPSWPNTPPSAKTTNNTQEKRNVKRRSMRERSDFGNNVRLTVIVLGVLFVGFLCKEFVYFFSDPKNYLYIVVGLLYIILCIKLGYGIRTYRNGEGFKSGFKTSLLVILGIRKKDKTAKSEKTQQWQQSQAKTKPTATTTAAKAPPVQKKEHTSICLKCGKAFPDYAHNQKYCNACRIEVLRAQNSNTQRAVNTVAKETQIPAQTCKVCGKKFPSDVNRATGICVECTEKLQQQQHNSNPVQYEYRCPVCGRAYSAQERKAGDLRCSSCRATAKQTGEKVTKPTATTVKASPKHPEQYKSVCLNCGKSFPDYAQNQKYCNACRVEAIHAKHNNMQSTANNVAKETQIPAQTCKVCGKKFPTYVNKSTGICMECTEKLQQRQNSNAVHYEYRCPVCGKTYSAQERKTGDLRCSSCRAAAKQTDENAKRVLSCPVCRTLLRVPAGKGRIAVTCSNKACGTRFIVDV